MIRKILAVDDELHMLKLLDQVISEKTSYQLTTTNNSLDIPKILAREHFSVVLTDLRMPGLDGMDILRWIKDNDRTEEVVIMTAFGTPESVRESMQLGAFDYLTKPIHRDELIITIERALKHRDMKKQLAQWRGLLEQATWAEAQEALLDEYLTRMGTNLGWDHQAIAEQSGIDLRELEKLIKRLESGSK